MSSFLLGLLMSFLTQSKFSNLILTLAKVRTRYRGIQTRLTKAINFPPWVKFTSLVVPLFDLRLNIAIAMPRGTRLVTTHPHPLFPPNNPQTYIFFSYFSKRISHTYNLAVLNSSYCWGAGHRMDSKNVTSKNHLLPCDLICRAPYH